MQEGNKIHERKDTDQIFKLLEKQDERLSRIEGAILGDTEMGSMGLVDRFMVAEEISRTNEKRLNKIYAQAGGIAFITSAIFQIMIIVFNVTDFLQ